MYSSKWCNDNLNSGNINWDYVKGELEELRCAKNYKEFKEELSDVIYSVLCVITYKTGINFPMFGAGYTIRKTIHRHEVWKGIFEMNELEFHPKYLVNGANYTKAHKVVSALNLARIDQKKKL